MRLVSFNGEPQASIPLLFAFGSPLNNAKVVRFASLHAPYETARTVKQLLLRLCRADGINLPVSVAANKCNNGPGTVCRIDKNSSRGTAVFCDVFQLSF